VTLENVSLLGSVIVLSKCCYTFHVGKSCRWSSVHVRVWKSMSHGACTCAENS